MVVLLRRLQLQIRRTWCPSKLSCTEALHPQHNNASCNPANLGVPVTREAMVSSPSVASTTLCPLVGKLSASSSLPLVDGWHSASDAAARLPAEHQQTLHHCLNVALSMLSAIQF